MKKIAALALTVALTACGGIDGQLNVTKSMTLKDRKNNSYQIPVGNYAINLQYKENKNRLIIQFDSLNGEKTKVEANTPEGFTIPSNGTFSLKAQDYGQNVDLDGTVKTVQTQSEERYGNESCQYTTWETICNTDPHGHTSCSQHPVNRTGWRNIRYYVVTTVQDLSAQFSAAGTRDEMAIMTTHGEYSEQRTVWADNCF